MTFVHNRRKSERGISLIEMAIVMIIVGILAIPLLQIYTIQRTNAIIDKDLSKLQAINIAIKRFASLNNRFPIPSDPSLGVTGGAEAAVPNMLTAPTCSTSAVIAGVQCVPGARDVATTTQIDPVLIGAIPYKALHLTYEQTIDAHGAQFTYAVGRQLASPIVVASPPSTTFNVNGGSINVINQAGVAAPSVTNQNALFVVFSAGEDRKGAYTPDGVQIACGTTGNGVDIENCDNDATFSVMTVTDPSSGNVTFAPKSRSMAAGTTYYDDIITYETNVSSDMWRAQNDGSRDNIYTNNGTRVVINGKNTSAALGSLNLDQTANTPSSMTVATEITLRPDEARAYSLRTQTVCDNTAYYASNTRFGCLNVRDITTPKTAGAQMNCNGNGKPFDHSVVTVPNTTVLTASGTSRIGYTRGRASCISNPALDSTEQRTCPNGYDGLDSTGFHCIP